MDDISYVWRWPWYTGHSYRFIPWSFMIWKTVDTKKTSHKRDISNLLALSKITLNLIWDSSNIQPKVAFLTKPIPLIQHGTLWNISRVTILPRQIAGLLREVSPPCRCLNYWSTPALWDHLFCATSLPIWEGGPSRQVWLCEPIMKTTKISYHIFLNACF